MTKVIDGHCAEPPYLLSILCIVFCQNRLRGSGHGIAAARMDAKLNAAGWMSEKMGGLRLEYYDNLMIYCEKTFIFTSVIHSCHIKCF